MQQLDHGCRGISAFIDLTVQAGRQENKDRSHLFPLAFQDVFCDRFDEGNGTLHGGHEVFFKGPDMIPDGLFYVGECAQNPFIS
jgi:hypothetical protein